MVNSIANISTLLSQGQDFLEASVERERYASQNSASVETVSAEEESSSRQEVSENIRDFAEELSQYVGDKNLALEFSKDDETQKMIMKLVNGETREVVKQFPPEISLKIARILSQSQSGNIANAKV